MTADFRNTYLSYDEITSTLKQWTQTYPDHVRLQSLGQTDEGRELWLLTIGPRPDEIRPAVWIDGNMHAAELCGSNVAMAIAEDMLKFFAEDEIPQALSPGVCAVLKDVLFYVMPRISPDGAEQMLTQSRYVRSNMRDERPDEGRSYWRPQDIDGDGLALAMRVEDPTGEFAAAPEVPNLLLPRTLDDEGPFYKLYPEGMIENYDGKTIPSPSFLSDSPTDLNRNFPWSWEPDHAQIGAGAFPGSEPESRAVIEFTSSHPNIFAWLNLHTFGGVGIRPLGDQPDTKMDQMDLAIFRQVAAWLEESSGYPTVSGFEEFTYEPEKPIRGDLIEYAYHQRGCIGYVIELWDLFAKVGLERKKPFVKSYTDLSREDMVAIAKWDRDHNAGRVLLEWRAFEHPQLGPVELGGVDPRVGMFNPPYELLAETCAQQSAAFLRVAAMAPMIRFGDIRQTDLGGGLTRLDISVENHGYLPSYVLNSAKKLSWNEALYLKLDCDGCALAEGHAQRTLGHLDGWGRGLGDGTGALYYPYGLGSTGTARQSIVVKGKGTVTATINSCRVGAIRQTIPVG
ncbi:MAG: M14 family metallopeptidase [Gammaproteobacteria bacterium]